MDALDDSRPPRSPWTLVVGVLGILVGARSIYALVWQMLNAHFPEKPLIRAALALGLVLSLAEVAGAVGLCLRRAWGRLLVCIVSAGSLVASVVGVMWTLFTVREWRTSHLSGSMALMVAVGIAWIAYRAVCLGFLLSPRCRADLGTEASDPGDRKVRRWMAVSAAVALAVSAAAYWRR